MAGRVDVEHLTAGSALELYISPTCPYCRRAMEFYDRAGMPYVIHDAQNNRDARARMLAYTHGDPTVPAIVVDGIYAQSGWGSPPQG
jgi:glutaredoxin